MASKFSIGDTVRLTGKHLRSTGQYTGSEAQGRWTVTGYSGPWLVVDEPTDTSIFTAAELAEDPSLAYRRFHPGNLERVKPRK